MKPRAHWPGMALAVVLCLFAVAPSAHAECAWVLWDQGVNTGIWINRGAYPSYSKCWTRIRALTGIAEEGSLADWGDWFRKAGRYRSIQDKSQTNSGFYSVPKESGALAMMGDRVWGDYSCLPDTIDPRGPKTGKWKRD
jgi:hypothetical protein